MQGCRSWRHTACRRRWSRLGRRCGAAAALPNRGLPHGALQRCAVLRRTVCRLQILPPPPPLPQGCMIKAHGGHEVIAMGACAGVKVVDTTGAGDAFAAGFLYALLQGYPLRRCGEIGCLAGGAVVQTLGSELGQEQWYVCVRRVAVRSASVSSVPSLPAHIGLPPPPPPAPTHPPPDATAGPGCTSGCTASWRGRWSATAPPRCSRRCWRATH